MNRLENTSDASIILGGKKKRFTRDKPADFISKEELLVKKRDFHQEDEDTEKIWAIKAKTPIDQSIIWYRDEYKKQWECEKLPRLAATKVEDQYGSVLRMYNISSMKYKFNYNTMDMIVVVMKLYDYSSRKETNYGTLFCELMDDITPMRKLLILNKAIHGNVAFTYYSASPSYISCDGEYRSRFSKFNSLLTAKERHSNIWHEIEEYVQRIRIRRQWSLYTRYFYPKLEQEARNNEVEFAVKNEFVPITILAISWFHTIFDEMLNITKTHINNAYKIIFLKEKETDILFLQALIKKYGNVKIEQFRADISHTSNNFHNQSNLYMQCGYKMIPLNIKEVQDPLRIRYKPWREYFISNKLNDLVVNSIAPNFPIILDWFYIKNSRKGLYDNKSQYDRMKHSELAKDILHILYEAQRGTYFAAENIKSMSKNSGQIKKWISGKFKKLSEKIDNPIEYSIEDIIMSEVTLAFASEYVGRTVADSVTLIQKSKVYNSMLGYPFKPIGFDYFAKYMFEICYGLFCANSKFGLMHGDFHLNNATIGALYYPSATIMANKDKKYKVAYVIDDQHQYIFPNNGYFANIIDFSRGIIDPSRFEELKDISLPATYQLVNNEKRFRHGEMNALLNLYTQMFPNKLRQKEELVVLFKNNFDAVFKLLTCIDLYMFSIRLSRILKQADIKINPAVTSLVEKINRLAEGYIATDMNHLINETATYGEKIANGDWPIFTIIKKCFPDYIDGKKFKTMGVITDMYIYKNKMKYSLAKYETFPEIIKTVKYYDPKNKKKIIEITEVKQRRKENRTEYERQKTQNLSMVNYIAKRHSEKLV